MTQNGVPFVQGDEVRNSWNRLGAVFQDVWFYVAPVPTYQGGFMAFGWASDNKSLRPGNAATLRDRFAASGIETRYYTPDVHVGSFALPGYILKLLD